MRKIRFCCASGEGLLGWFGGWIIETGLVGNSDVTFRMLLLLWQFHVKLTHLTLIQDKVGALIIIAFAKDYLKVIKLIKKYTSPYSKINCESISQVKWIKSISVSVAPVWPWYFNCHFKRDTTETN